jgi:hypothetical protein
MISVILARSAGPPADLVLASATARKYSGPIAAGVIHAERLTSWIPSPARLLRIDG